MSRHFGRQINSIRKLWAKFRQTGSVRDRRRQPRSRVTSRPQDRYIVLTHLRNRFKSATSTARATRGLHGRIISSQTVRNRLKEANLRARRPRRCLVLTQRHKRARLLWARRHLRLTRADWANVLFVDETKIKLKGSDGRKRVYRRPGERHSANCVDEIDRFGGGGSIMGWAGISMHTKTPITCVQGGLTANRYQNVILGPVALPHIAANRGMILAQDNAPCHTAQTTRQYLAANNIQIMPLPAKSPDLNPIEHIWDLLKQRVRSLPQPPTLRVLEQNTNQIWNNITQRTIQGYILSMRKRCLAVIRARGGHTEY